MVSLGHRGYGVRSNRESGYGRYDVLVAPQTPGEPGVVLELKRVTGKGAGAIRHALDSALVQLQERDYAAELRASGATPIHQLAVVMDGKRARVASLHADVAL